MPSTRIAEFDTWRPGYGLSTVSVFQAGTSILAAVFIDEALTVPALNPQTLLDRVDGASGISYGRFSQPLYVGVPYELQINTVDRTGVTRPALTTLDAQDGSNATVQVTGGDENLALADILARSIDVRDYGDFIAVGDQNASTATNTATLIDALAVAGTRGGGFVEIPPGTFQVSFFIIPAGVVIRGTGRVGSTLQSTQAGKVATLGGDRSGFSRVTLDGVTLVVNSVGVYSESVDQIVMDDVEVKRFETGIFCKGGILSDWRDVYISNCTNGYRCHGDSALTLGSARRFNSWHGGKVELCTAVGIELKNVDLACDYQTFSEINFDTNTAIAVHVIGARDVVWQDCWWTANASNLTVEDALPASTTNTVVGLQVIGSTVDTGTIDLNGRLESVAFLNSALSNLTVTLTTPGHNVVAQDCRETDVLFAGLSIAWIRHKSDERGASSGLTTGNAATEAWVLQLDPGQYAYLEAKVIGRQRNGINTGFYHFAVSVGRAGASLAYDGESVNFSAGAVLTGATSGATARISADSDSGTFGTLTLQDVVGAFVDDETLTDSLGGTAQTNGTLSFTNAALIGSITQIRAAQETNANWAAAFVANGPNIELQVTGDTAQTVEWTVDVDVVSN